MCGKFTQMLSWATLHDLADIINAPGHAPGGAHSDTEEFTTPMRFAHVVRLGDGGGREAVRMRWGFADMRAKNPLEKPKHMHARAETIDTLPTFANAFAHNRGLIFVKDFNIGEEVTPRKTVQHVVRPRDGKPLALGVIWERWINPSSGELLTFVMITVPANALIGAKTDRMPAVIVPENFAKWLGEEPAHPLELKAMLQTVEGDWDMQPQKPKAPPAKPGAGVQKELF